MYPIQPGEARTWYSAKPDDSSADATGTGRAAGAAAEECVVEARASAGPAMVLDYGGVNSRLEQGAMAGSGAGGVEGVSAAAQANAAVDAVMWDAAALKPLMNARQLSESYFITLDVTVLEVSSTLMKASFCALLSCAVRTYHLLPSCMLRTVSAILVTGPQPELA